jgi:hypothetical protein
MSVMSQKKSFNNKQKKVCVYVFRLGNSLGYFGVCGGLISCLRYANKSTLQSHKQLRIDLHANLF